MTLSLSFTQKVVDILLPGLPARGTKPAIPSASEVGVHQQLAVHSESNQAIQSVLNHLCDLAGGEARFIILDEEGATAVITQLATEKPDDFQAFLFIVKADYYEHETILEVFHWSAQPPQPAGYPLTPPLDETALEAVKKRGSIWRKT